MTFYPLTSTVGGCFSKSDLHLKMFRNAKMDLVFVVLSEFRGLENGPVNKCACCASMRI